MVAMGQVTGGSGRVFRQGLAHDPRGNGATSYETETADGDNTLPLLTLRYAGCAINPALLTLCASLGAYLCRSRTELASSHYMLQ